MTDSNDVKVEKKKFSLFNRKKQQQLDEYGNPLVLPKKKRFSYHRLNRSFGGDLALSIVLFVGGVFMLFKPKNRDIYAREGYLTVSLRSRISLIITSISW